MTLEQTGNLAAEVAFVIPYVVHRMNISLIPFTIAPSHGNKETLKKHSLQVLSFPSGVFLQSRLRSSAVMGIRTRASWTLPAVSSHSGWDSETE